MWRGGGATRTKTPLDNGGIKPLLTQTPSQYPPPVDAPDAPDSPPPGAQEDASDSACLVSVANLPGERLMATDDNIFSFYQDWVHQNPGTYMDGGVEDDGKWQEW